MKAVPASRYSIFLLIAVGGCAVDLRTKSWMFSRLGMPGGPTWWVWQDVLGFQTSLNEGALFGMGQGMAAVFAVLSLAAAAGIVYWLFCAGAARDGFLTVALSSIAAGILGNLYDRLGLPGLEWPAGHPLRSANASVHAVRDWILVMIGKYPWPTFNIADSLLVCGALLLMWHSLRPRLKEQPPANADRGAS
jgi:signal peptidase II